jgi:signal transduction histidine kinase
MLSLKRAEEIALNRFQAVERVTRSIAHEISNPLAIIHTNLAVLERKITGSNSIEHNLQLICTEIERIGSIARQLENLSELSSPKPAGTERLDSLLKDVLTLFRESVFAVQQIEVTIKLGPETRSLAVPSDIFRQVLTILFSNAAEAIGINGRIRVSSALEQDQNSSGNGMLRLSVADDGPGIPRELTDTLFNAGITTKEAGHLGLGLSIARKLLNEAGGSLTYTRVATTDSGACFEVRLPMQH